MSLIITNNILNILIDKHNKELNKIINNIYIGNDNKIDINLIPELNNIKIFNKKKFIINNDIRCKAMNSHKTQCKRNYIEGYEYCKKHIKNNKGNYCDTTNDNNVKSNIKIDCEYITIDNIKYIFNKNNLLLFKDDMYNPECIGIYYNNKIIYYDSTIEYSKLI